MNPLPLIAAALSLAAAPVVAGAQPGDYRSAFTDYRPYADVEVTAWRASNDQFRDGGAHAGHGAPPPPPAADRGATRPADPAADPGAHAGAHP